VGVGVSVYAGPAVLVLDDGRWFRVVARLESASAAGADAWRGSVTCDPRPLWDAMRAGRALLHLPDDRRAVFTPLRIEGSAGRTLRLIGFGRAPF
jgi:hypothetical protein